MGLISAALSAATSTLSQQWKEYFYCDALPFDVLAVRGWNHFISQILSQYSLMDLSEEKYPEFAMFTRDILLNLSLSV